MYHLHYNPSLLNTPTFYLCDRRGGVDPGVNAWGEEMLVPAVAAEGGFLCGPCRGLKPLLATETCCIAGCSRRVLTEHLCDPHWRKKKSTGKMPRPVQGGRRIPDGYPMSASTAARRRSEARKLAA